MFYLVSLFCVGSEFVLFPIRKECCTLWVCVVLEMIFCFSQSEKNVLVSCVVLELIFCLHNKKNVYVSFRLLFAAGFRLALAALCFTCKFAYLRWSWNCVELKASGLVLCVMRLCCVGTDFVHIFAIRKKCCTLWVCFVLEVNLCFSPSEKNVVLCEFVLCWKWFCAFSNQKRLFYLVSLFCVGSDFLLFAIKKKSSCELSSEWHWLAVFFFPTSIFPPKKIIIMVVGVLSSWTWLTTELTSKKKNIWNHREGGGGGHGAVPAYYSPVHGTDIRPGNEDKASCPRVLLPGKKGVRTWDLGYGSPRS